MKNTSVYSNTPTRRNDSGKATETLTTNSSLPFSVPIQVDKGGTGSTVPLTTDKIIVSSNGKMVEGTSSLIPSFNSANMTDMTAESTYSDDLVYIDAKTGELKQGFNVDDLVGSRPDLSGSIAIYGGNELGYSSMVNVNEVTNVITVGNNLTNVIISGTVTVNNTQSLTNLVVSGSFTSLNTNTLANTLMTNTNMNGITNITTLFATNSSLGTAIADSLELTGISNSITPNFLYYDTGTNEVTYGALSVPAGENFVTTTNGTVLNKSAKLKTTLTGAQLVSGALSISSTTNQFILGTTNTVTLNSVAPTASRIYNIPDVGTNSSFLMTDGTQTITGNKTFSGTITLSSLSASLPLQTDASKNVITAAISLTSSVSGILPITNGGTNSTTALVNGKIMVSSGGKIVEGTSSTTPSFLSMSLTATSNQLTLGTTNTCTINVDSAGFTSTLVGGSAYSLIGSSGNPNVLNIENSSGKYLAIMIDSGATPNAFIHNSYAGNIVFSNSTLTNINLSIHDNGNVDILSKMSSATANISSLTASSPVLTDGSNNLVSGNINLASQVTGILPIANGGTNSSTALANGKIMVSAGGKIVEGTSSSTPTFTSETLTSTTNQLVLGTTNTITLNSTAPAASRTYTIPDTGANSSFVLTDGNITINGNKTFSSAITINPTTNQIVLGVTNTVTINSTAPSSSRTYTIPDTGANSSFVMTDGTQTINGNKTLTGTINLSSLTALLPLQLDGSNNIISAAISLTTGASGILPIANGGTNSSTALVNGKIMVSAGGKIVEGTSSTTPIFISETLTSTTNQLVLGTTNTVTLNSTAPVASRTYTIPDTGANSSFVLTDGNITINGSKTFSSAVTINPTTNQIILGVTNTVTINSVAPVASRTYTIPDTGANSSFILTDGNVTINGNKTFSSAITINPTTNQIILGVTNTVTINSVAPAASRTYTIPDTGTNSSFILTDGNITINGNKTLTGTVALSSLTASLPLQLDGSNNIISAAISLSDGEITGLLPIANGGTNSSTALVNGKIMVSSGGKIVEGTSSTTPTFTSETLTATTNQIVLGTTNTVTLNSVAPVASRTYTIPDTGTNSSFVMTDGTQTINGNKTLTGTINLSSLTASLPLQLDGSKNIVSTAINLAGSQVSGILPVANGGTNSSTALNNNRIMVSTSGKIQEAAALTDGQLLIGSTGVTPIAANITGSANQIGVTNGAGTINITNVNNMAVISTSVTANNTAATTGGYFAWQNSIYSTYTTATVIFWVVQTNRNVTVGIFDGTTTLGSATIIGAFTGIGTFTFTLPVVDSRLEIQFNKSAAAGANPVVYGVTIKLS